VLSRLLTGVATESAVRRFFGGFTRGRKWIIKNLPSAAVTCSHTQDRNSEDTAANHGGGFKLHLILLAFSKSHTSGFFHSTTLIGRYVLSISISFSICFSIVLTPLRCRV
jgi:hypothetical protein